MSRRGLLTVLLAACMVMGFAAPAAALGARITELRAQGTEEFVGLTPVLRENDESKLRV